MSIFSRISRLKVFSHQGWILHKEFAQLYFQSLWDRTHGQQMFAERKSNHDFLASPCIKLFRGEEANPGRLTNPDGAT